MKEGKIKRYCVMDFLSIAQVPLQKVSLFSSGSLVVFVRHNKMFHCAFFLSSDEEKLFLSVVVDSMSFFSFLYERSNFFVSLQETPQFLSSCCLSRSK